MIALLAVLALVALVAVATLPLILCIGGACLRDHEHGGDHRTDIF